MIYANSQLLEEAVQRAVAENPDASINRISRIVGADRRTVKKYAPQLTVRPAPTRLPPAAITGVAVTGTDRPVTRAEFEAFKADMLEEWATIKAAHALVNMKFRDAVSAIHREQMIESFEEFTP